jgi:hypothetical protein
MVELQMLRLKATEFQSPGVTSLLGIPSLHFSFLFFLSIFRSSILVRIYGCEYIYILEGIWRIAFVRDICRREE